jgi:endoglycosylceramidase
VSRKLIAVPIVAILVLVLVPGIRAFASGAEKASPPRFVVRDGEIYDAQGRIAYFRGVNVSGNAKVEPDHLPFQPDETQWWDYLKAWGFNLVRFTVFWEGIEPVKGRFDRVYIWKVKRLLEEAAKRGIYAMVDMHQDLYSRWLHGDGAPDWAVWEAGACPYFNLSWGGRFWGLANFLSPAVVRCFTNFWRSDDLKLHYKNALVEVARQLKDNPYVLGYDVYNEPIDVGCANTNGEFENGLLAPLYEDVLSGIRKVDPDSIGFVEPSSVDMHSSKFNESTFRLDRLVFAPHIYDFISGNIRFQILPSDQIYREDHALDLAKARQLGMPLWIGEFGTLWDMNPPGAHDRMVDDMYKVLESGFTSNAIWDYSVKDVAAWNGEDCSLIDQNGRPRGLQEAVRPWVRRLAGSPSSQSFYKNTKVYSLEFTGDPGPQPTVVYVPEAVHYPAGFQVSTSDGSWEYRAASNELLYRPGRSGAHRLTIWQR